jgi:hypothetical protein
MPEKPDSYKTAKRPTKREFREAIGVLKNEIAGLRSFSEKWSEDLGGISYMANLAGQRGRRADRIERVIAWMEALHAA